MSTLVIHPEDPTTAFLERIYRDLPDKVVLTGPVPEAELVALIESSARVLMCGHGTWNGLIGYNSYVIHTDLAELLKSKKNSCIYIWCHADRFVEDLDLAGIYSGMFISEMQEADLYDIPATEELVNASNLAFVNAFRDAIASTSVWDIFTIHKKLVDEYGMTAEHNPIASYNHSRLYVRDHSEKELLKLVRRCLLDHPLGRVSGHSGRGRPESVICNKCRQRTASFYCCEECDFDVCKSCFDQQYRTLVSYKLSYEVGHMFLHLPAGCFLVDTGSPITFGASAGMSLAYGHMVHNNISTRAGPISMDSLRGLPEVYSRMEGLLGMDILVSYAVLWDGPSGVAQLNCPIDPLAIKIPIDLVYGYYIMFQAHIMGRPVTCLFDTGAQFGYAVDPELLASATPAGDIEDYNPLIGSISCHSWIAEVEITDKKPGVVDERAHNIKERFGILPSGMLRTMLVEMRVDVIVGCSWMRDKKVWFTPSTQSIHIL